MNAGNSENEYFRTPAEVADALGLPLLGSLVAEPRFHQLADGLASLSPDPLFSGRLYRVVEGETPLVWVIGLGDAGEELPVAVGLAEMASVSGGAPVLLAQTRETSAAAGGGERNGRPIFSHRFSEAVAALCPAGCVAGTSGIQGVFRIWAQGATDGAPLEPASMIVAGPCPDGPPELPPSVVTHLILVVPYRDQPRGRILAQTETIRAAGFSITGCVAYGPKPAAATPEPEVEREESEESEFAVAPADEEAIEQHSVPVQQVWSDTFGPRSLRGPARRPRWLLPLLAASGAVIAFVAVTLLIWRSTPHRVAPPPATRVTAADKARAIPPGSALAGAPVAAPDSSAPAGADTAAGPPADTVATETQAPPAARVAAPVVAEPVETARREPVPEPPAEAPREAVRDMVDDRGPPFAVLCGSFREAARAEREAARLAQQGRGTRIVRVRIPGQGEWRRVVVGEFATLEAARRAADGIAPGAQVVAAAGLGRVLAVAAGPATR